MGLGPRHGAFAVATLAPALGPAMAMAADWSVHSAAQVQAVAESNPQLLNGGENSAQAGVAMLSLGLMRRTELLDLDLDARGSARRYGQDSDLDRDDQEASLALSRRGERYVVQASASLKRDTTLTSELGTTGITRFNQKHRARSLSLAPRWQFSERLGAGASLGWQDSNYGYNPQAGLSNYNYRLVGMNTDFAVNETTSASLVVNGGRLDSALYDFNTESISARLQLRHSFSPRWQASLSGGPSKVKTGRSSAKGSVYSASVVRAGERLDLDGSLSRSIEPTGSGLLSRRDEFAVGVRAALSEQLDLAAGVSMLRSRSLLPEYSFTLSDVRYTRAELSLSWRVARDWSIGFSTGNSRQKDLASEAIGKGFDARLMLAWQRDDLG